MAGHEPGVLQQAAQVGVMIEAGRGADQEQVLVAVQQAQDQLRQGRLDVGLGQLAQLLARVAGGHKGWPGCSNSGSKALRSPPRERMLSSVSRYLTLIWSSCL